MTYESTSVLLECSVIEIHRESTMCQALLHLVDKKREIDLCLCEDYLPTAFLIRVPPLNDHIHYFASFSKDGR